jgi:lactoylglutathione lyase
VTSSSMIYPHADGAAADRSTRIGLELSDLDSTLQRLACAGVTIRTRPTETPWGRRAVVIDSDGRSVELVTRPNPTGEV